jgi:hypothetical protein
MRSVLILLPLALVVVAGCAEPPPEPPPFRPVANMPQLMLHVLDPAADVIWTSVGTIITAEGVDERQPRTEEEWEAVVNSAYMLAESGNLLMMDTRPRDTDEWMRLAQALIDVSTKTIQAAEAHDKQSVFDLGAEIYAVCTNCHQKYAPAIARVG